MCSCPPPSGLGWAAGHFMMLHHRFSVKKISAGYIWNWLCSGLVNAFLRRSQTEGARRGLWQCGGEGPTSAHRALIRGGRRCLVPNCNSWVKSQLPAFQPCWYFFFPQGYLVTLKVAPNSWWKSKCSIRGILLSHLRSFSKTTPALALDWWIKFA